jgi:SAM-dependent methyltransferase
VTATATATATAFVCKLCRGERVGKSYLLQRPWKNRTPFVVVTCAGCGLLQNLYDWQHAVDVQRSERLRLTERDAHELWDSEAEIDAGTDKAAGFAERLDALGMVQSKRILEVGCGKGLFLRRCRDLGAASVTGQEFFNQRPLDYARMELGIDDIRTVGFEDTATWPDGEFDVVCSFDVVEHVHDLQHFFRHCVRIARPGGVQYHATPGAGSVSNRVGRLLVGPFGSLGRLRTTGTALCNLQHDDNFRGGAHVSLLDVRQVHWLAERFGLTVLDARYVSNYTYSNRHYAALLPVVRQLPPAVGAGLFGVVRAAIRNKLVFAARVPG